MMYVINLTISLFLMRGCNWNINILASDLQDSQLPEDSVHDIARDLVRALQ